MMTVCAGTVTMTGIARLGRWKPDVSGNLTFRLRLRPFAIGMSSYDDLGSCLVLPDPQKSRRGRAPVVAAPNGTPAGPVAIASEIQPRHRPWQCRVQRPGALSKDHPPVDVSTIEDMARILARRAPEKRLKSAKKKAADRDDEFLLPIVIGQGSWPCRLSKMSMRKLLIRHRT